MHPENACAITVTGGTEGVDYYYENAPYTRDHPVNPNPAATLPALTCDLKKLVICSDTPLTLSTDGTGSVDGTIWITPGTQADLTFEGVNITSDIPVHIERNRDASGKTISPETSLHITLADNSDNTIQATADGSSPGIHCGEGTCLTIDDAVRNADSSGNPITPKNGRIPAGTTFVDHEGTVRTATPNDHNSLTLLETQETSARKTGALTVRAGHQAAGIGSTSYENSGKMTFNGGVIDVKGFKVTGASADDYNYGVGAGIGSGEGGSCTFITFNGGRITAEGSYHGAAIGTGLAAWYDPNYYGRKMTYLFQDSIDSGRTEGRGTSYPDSQLSTGRIEINSGWIRAIAPVHGNAIGHGCATLNEGGAIIISGGTILPDSTASASGFVDVGGMRGYVIITGGSVRTTEDGSKFENRDAYGYAYGTYSWSDQGNLVVNEAESNKVFMVTVDLSSEIEKRNQEAGITDSPLDELVTDWNLTVGGATYPYGAPTRFSDGKLFLWLPKTATSKEITVNLSYVDKNGKTQKIEPLFRNPGTDQDGDILKRYIDFELPASYLDALTKHYDGESFETFKLDEQAPPLTGLVTDADGNRVSDGKPLTDTSKVTYKYQLYDKRGGSPVGTEVAAAPDGSPLTAMPADVGVMKFTMDSSQWSDTDGFKESYWGHRATGWCEIKPIASKVSELAAVWADEADEGKKPGEVAHPSDQVLQLSATIGRADTVDGKAGSEATKATCKAPRGRVQLFVDGEPVGDPVELVYAGDADENGAAIPEGDPRVNAVAVPNGEGGETCRFTFSRAASAADFLVPTQGQQGHHEVSLQFLPPSEDQQEAGVPANYLESADPAKDPSAPSAEVAIEPIDPNPTVTPTPDPDCKDPDFPAPSVETGPGEPDDPAADPSEPGDKTYHGSITTTWGEPSKDNPHPGRVTLSIKTPSTGKISVTDASGNVFTADFLKDADGRPARGEDGTYTLVLDPTAVGSGKLTIRQEANGAYTGSTWVYDVTVNPDVTVAPAPSLSKKAENLTHPDGPTQPGDRIRYTITAANGAAGSLWTDAVVSDPLPACLGLDEGSVRLDNPRGGVADKALAKAPLVAASDVGKFALAAAGANGRRVLTVSAGNVPGGAEATITFECTVAVDAAGEDAPAADLTNIAEATGTRPDPADPDKPMPDPANPGKPLPIDPDPTDPVTPPGPGRVVPADPEIGLTKTVENLTAPDASVTRIGDRLLYTVTLANTGAANSCLVNAVISDPLPVGIEPAAGTLKLAAGGGASVPVPDGAYDRGTRTIAVTCGDIWGGGSAVLTFEVIVEAAALGQNSANIAHAHGSIPSENPGTVPSDPDPGKPTEPPADEPLASSDPVEPPTIIPDDPGRDDLSIAKTAENASRDDGTTHVGDTVRYCIALANSGPATGWMDAVIRDDVPRGLEPIAGTIRLALPDGREVAVDDGAYDPATRILAVAVGHLYGGQEAALSFDALVTKDALDTDIGNVGTAFGTPPSQWDPDRPAPAPGDPFRPEEGWDGYIRSHESVSTDPVYPPGVTTRGGILQDADDSSTAREKQRATIAHKLAQTGDALSLALLLSATLALAAGALALAGRRRARRAR